MLPLLSAMPAVTFSSGKHHRPLAGTTLYCFVTEESRCEQLAQGCHAAFAPRRIWTHDLLIASPTLYPLRHRTVHYPYTLCPKNSVHFFSCLLTVLCSAVFLHLLCQLHYKCFMMMTIYDEDDNYFVARNSDRIYPPTAYTGRFLQWVCSGGANRHKLITSFTQTKVVTNSFKATWPQKLLPLVTTALLHGVTIYIVDPNSL